MTTEVAILNVGAVALAADSAVTVGLSKTYPSVDKLFPLSKYHPVGVMIYNGADFMGIPWETIIKVYRDSLGTSQKPLLNDYLDDFLEFLTDPEGLITADLQANHFRETIGFFFFGILEQLGKEMTCLPDGGESLSEAQKTERLERLIEENHKKFLSIEKLSHWSADDEDKLLRSYSDLVHKVCDDLFATYQLSAQALQRLREISVALFSRDYWLRYTGVVMAGFGEKEVFPVLRSFIVSGVVNNKARMIRTEHKDFTISPPRPTAAVIPFAQEDMVRSFMQGIDPTIQGDVVDFLKEFLTGFPDAVVSRIPGLEEQTKETIANDLKDVCSKMLDQFQNRLQRKTWDEFVEPILNAINSLPKGELAEMAEALVSLTSLKRRFTIRQGEQHRHMNLETVGGPVDVAVISKGDGFVWIKKKSYFSLEANPGFIVKSYREVYERRGE